ncbi:MAG: thiamine pyrophosphate-binding protein [Anaerotruncus massiliensis (ex Togo et al. 2019)]
MIIVLNNCNPAWRRNWHERTIYRRPAGRQSDGRVWRKSGIRGPRRADPLCHRSHSGRSGMRFVHTRHENGAATAADGWGRLTGEPGICLATTGPGATNLITGLGGPCGIPARSSRWSSRTAC